jgi:hypothetical protein
MELVLHVLLDKQFFSADYGGKKREDDKNPKMDNEPVKECEWYVEMESL